MAASGPSSTEAPQPQVFNKPGKSFWAAAYALFILLAGTNLATPLYHGYELAFTHSALTTTLIFASYVAALVPALLVAGSLADAIGRRRVLLPALLLAIFASLVFALADGTCWLFVARILQGLSAGAASGVLTAALAELEPTGNHRRATLVATVASLGGLGAGPLVAGLIAQYGPGPYVTPFILEVALLVPAVLFILVLPETSGSAKWRPRRPSIPPSMRQVFAISGVANFLAFSVIGLFLCLMPTYIQKLSATRNLAIAGGTVTLMLFCSVIAQAISYGRPPLRLQIAGIGMLSMGLILLAVAGHASLLPVMLVASIIAGSGHGMTFLGGLTEINRLAPPGRHAEVVSSFYIIVYLGVGIPVIGAGLLATRAGALFAIQAFTAVTVPLLLITLALLAITHEKLKRGA